MSDPTPIKTAICNEFMRSELSRLGAIERLQTLGYAPKEAEQLVSEWEAMR